MEHAEVKPKWELFICFVSLFSSFANQWALTTSQAHVAERRPHQSMELEKNANNFYSYGVVCFHRKI